MHPHKKYNFICNTFQVEDIDDEPIYSEKIKEEVTPPPLKTILFWNTFFGSINFHFGLGQQPFRDTKCAVSDCFLTNNRSMFNQSDAIFFAWQNMNTSDLPPYRFAHQRFVYYQMESPATTDPRPFLVPNIRYNFFNWTMTYRLDSDIYNRHSYGITIPNNRQLPVSYPKVDKGSSALSVVHLQNEQQAAIKLKKKMVAWFVSHCKTASAREKYVEELSEYVAVDIYGKCGNLTCPDSQRDQCFDKLKTTYKFYLSFENAFCPDYVTEKLFNALRYDVVPIVMGGADYSKFAPPNSYINVIDFQSPKHLADYLKLLNENDDLYAHYFNWKKLLRTR